MADFAQSSDPAVQAQLDRLAALGPGADVLGLERIAKLLDRLDHPERDLPPVFHVAGTNGKGSTCAYLRAALEADGRRVHVFTSPHLVRFNERIRINSRLIADPALADLLAEVLDKGGDLGASFFEVTTAAAFLAFARTPADACVIEVGLGGRLDATNVLINPASCGIAQLGIDHEAFLGSDLSGIGAEKAGIAKAGRPLVTLGYPDAVAASVARTAADRGALLLPAGEAWRYESHASGLTVVDWRGEITVRSPSLAGTHQGANLALAIAMLRAQHRLDVSDAALGAAPHAACWPARMQLLGPGPLRALLPRDSALWLDGGHNAAAAEAISRTLAEQAAGRRVHLVCGMLANKDARGLLAPFTPIAESLHGVPVPGHAHHSPAELAGVARDLGVTRVAAVADPADALRAIAADTAHKSGPPPIVLILGSLYLAGEVLRANEELPD